jgi:hypothetical protein
MTASGDDGEAHLFDGHGEYQHVGITRAKVRVAVLVFGSILIITVVGGMFLY